MKIIRVELLEAGTVVVTLEGSPVGPEPGWSEIHLPLEAWSLDDLERLVRAVNGRHSGRVDVVGWRCDAAQIDWGRQARPASGDRIDSMRYALWSHGMFRRLG